MFTDWSDLVDGVLKRNDDCTAINNKTLKYTIDCPYTPTNSENDKRLLDFKHTCTRLKGQWFPRDNGGSLLKVDTMQQRLAIPGRYPPKFPSSLERGNVVYEDVDEGWTSRVDHAGKVGAKEAVYCSSTRNGGRKKAGYEEDDTPIAFVTEDL